jgi:aldehyde:ferredoxin oxidoreductase
MLYKDPLKNVLYIDLTSKRFWVEDREDLFDKYLGGVGVASKLLFDECPKGIDPLDSENPIIFAVGPLNGLFPLASKTVACFKSPLTKNYGESHAGGRSSISIRLAGYGAIVIKGASSNPIYLSINGSKVQFRDASALWGVRSTLTVGRVIMEIEGGEGFRSIMRIGGAGERLVSYASLNADTYRHFGRLGLGAVFGSKKLKALFISGKRSLPFLDSGKYGKIYDEIYNYAVKSPLMRKYHELGTAVNASPLNEMGALPTKNLKNTKHNEATEIFGESLAENYLGRRVACIHCPVACIHLAALREKYESEPYFYKTVMISYDYELIYALGSMLGISKAENMLRLMDLVEIYGLDAMYTGVMLSWLTEAMERKKIGEKETLVSKVKWGDFEAYLKIIRNIITQPNEFYVKLAKGLDEVVKQYGGEDFALTFGGNGMPGYHTGIAAHVTYLTGARHSHLDSAGYSIDQKMMGEGERLSSEDLAKMVFEEESWRQILSSLVICFFSRGLYKPDLVKRALEVVGFNLSEDELFRLGEEILRNKYQFKIREGFDFYNLRVPRRIFETPTPLGFIDEEELRSTVMKYKELIISDAHANN